MTGPRDGRTRAEDDGDAGARGRDPEDLERAAEELAGRLTRWAVRTAARAKEEAEDIWAEAQELRRRR